jgi:hypothetical protein
MRIRQLANQVWELLGGWKAALLALLLLTVTQIISLALPQIPVSADESAAFNLWLAVVRPQLGQTTRPLASLGLLTIRTSPLLRATLALVGLVIAANLDRLREGMRDGAWTRRQTGLLLICAGGLLIIGGWSAQMLSGWRDPEVIVWPDEGLVITGYAPSAAHASTLPQPTGPLAIWHGRYGHYVIRRGQRVGLEVEALDADDEPLPLLRAVGEEPQTHVRLAFTTSEPEAFFALQEAELIFRLNQIQAAIQVQAYRSASGELLTETLLGESDAGARLLLDGVDVIITRTFLPRYEVIYNPGAAPEALGMALLAAGTILRLALHPPGMEDAPAEISTPDEGPEPAAS